jgi:hypothetical protein
MRTFACLLLGVCLCGAAVAAEDDETFTYDDTGLRDPMRRQTPAPVVDETGVPQEAQPQAAEASRLEDIQRVIAACRIEGVAVGPRGRFVIINDRVVTEGEPISAEYDVRVAKIEPEKVTFTLDTQALTYVLTPPEEETLP